MERCANGVRRADFRLRGSVAFAPPCGESGRSSKMICVSLLRVRSASAGVPHCHFKAARRMG